MGRLRMKSSITALAIGMGLPSQCAAYFEVSTALQPLPQSRLILLHMRCCFLSVVPPLLLVCQEGAEMPLKPPTLPASARLHYFGEVLLHVYQICTASTCTMARGKM
jgi:hypothetical protein